MEERMKILGLLQEGKITAEQAELLLRAVSENASSKDTSRSKSGQWEKTATELKSLKTQMTSLMSQTISEVKRSIETQIDVWPFGEFVSSTVEHSFTPGITELNLVTTQGKVHVESWDGPTIRAYIRAEVRPMEGGTAKQVLEDALEIRETDNRASLQILRPEGRRVIGPTSIDLFIPNLSNLALSVESKNGSIHADKIEISSLDAKTHNGSVIVTHSKLFTLEVETHNGHIEIRDSVGLDTQRVNASSKNGTVTLTGIHPGLSCIGKARTTLGHIDVDERAFECTYEDARLRNRASFRLVVPEATRETRMELETKHGKISIRA
jgi:DUF4097 and DUF4098 domain-containing protein YvlB